MHLAGMGNLEETLLSVVTRHPMREDELMVLLNRWSAEELQTALAELDKAHKIQTVERGGHIFWTAADAHYPYSSNS